MTEHITPDVTQLKALTHPLRLRLLGLLRELGPATATRLAERLGINTGATSYHLRQLAAHGFIVEDRTLGSARERWWRATAAYTSIEEPPGGDAAARDAVDAFWQAALTQQVRALQQAVEARSTLPRQWRAVSSASDIEVWATPEQARAIYRRLDALLDECVAGLPHQSAEPPPGAERFGIQVHTYVHPRP